MDVVAQRFGAAARAFADRAGGSVREDEQGDRGGDGSGRNKVGWWWRRYAEEGLAGSRKERPPGGNQAGRSDAEREALRSQIVELTTTTLPKDGTRWSCRTMAREVGATHDFVSSRIACR